MQRRLGFSFALALVAAVIGFGRFAGDALGTVMRVLFLVALVALVSMLGSALFARRRADACRGPTRTLT
jgi:uncharacterized membrane protein YtjA (UPF0391 family)